MSEFRYKFDTVEVDQPLNWDQLEISYKRDKRLSGLFTKFSSKAKWIGTAYDAIQTAIASGICTEIVVEIDYRCSKFDSWTNEITGIIILSDAEIDSDDCIITASVEPNSCQSVLLDSFDVEIDVLANESISGTISMSSPIQQILNPFESQSGATYGSLGRANMYGIRVQDFFDFAVKYLTDDCIEFTSDFFTTDFQKQIIRIDFTTNPGNGDTISIQLNDVLYGIEYESKVVVDYLRSYYVDFRNTIVLSDTVDTPLNAFTEPALATYSIPGGGVLARIDIDCYHEVEIDSFSAGTGAGTATELQPLIKGGKGYFISNGLIVKADKFTERGANVFTVLDVFNTLNSLFDLGISFEESGGTTYLRIEPKEYYLSTTSALTIRDIVDAKVTIDEDQYGPSVGLGSKAVTWDAYTFSGSFSSIEQNGNSTFFNEPFTLNGFDCTKFVDRFHVNDWYASFGEKIDVVTSGTQDIDDQLYVIACEDSGGTWDAYSYRYNLYDYTVGLTIKNWYCYNKLMINDVLSYFHKYTLPIINLTDSGFGSKTNYLRELTGGGVYQITRTVLGDMTTDEGDGFAYRVWEFTRYISKSDFDLISAGQSITINTGSDPSDDVKAFILEVKHNLDSGETIFFLISK